MRIKGTSVIADIIAKQSHLQTLAVNLDLNHMENQGAERLAKALKQIQKLDTLELGIASKNYGIKGFTAII